MSTFKKRTVVMLPTNEKANNIYSSKELLLKINTVTPNHLKFGNNSPFDILGGYYKPQHLYFLSDEEIKEGDWYLDKSNTVQRCETVRDNILTGPKSSVGAEKVKGFAKWSTQYQDENFKSLNNCKKIVATTDESLEINQKIVYSYHYVSLPQPSQSFLEKFVEEYNKGNVITEVMVEYWEEEINPNPKYDVLKVNPKDNTITIRKVKDSWNRKEVINILDTLLEYPDVLIDAVQNENTKYDGKALLDLLDNL